MLNFSQININKNALMFLTSLVYILGLCAYQLHYPVLYSVCITIVLGLLCILNLIKPKYLFVWILTFYIGLFNAMLRISDSDILKNIAPVDGSFTGQIVSIPNSNIENNSKFFFKVTKADYEHKTIDKINSKLLVSVTDKENSEEFNKLKISNFYTIKGSLRPPFKPGNPSQFNYGAYLKNYGAHTILYCSMEDITALNNKPTGWSAFIQKLNDVRSKIITTHSSYLKSPNLELQGGIVYGDDAVATPDYIKTTIIKSALLHIIAD